MGKNLKLLLKSLREYKKSSILTPITIIGEVVMEVAIPYVMAILIDRGIDAGNMGVIVKIGIILLVMAFVSLFFGALAGRLAAVASSGFARNLRHDLYEKIQTFSFSNIDRFSTASLITRLTTDVTNLQFAYQMAIRTLSRSPIMMIAALVLSFSINARLAWIFVVIIPILLFALLWLATRVHPIFERVFKTYDSLNEVTQENLHGIRVVKSFRREYYEIGKFSNISGRIYQDFKKAEQLIALNFPIMTIAVYGSMIAIAWFGAKTIIASGGLAIAGGLTTGELMSLFTYAIQILMSLIMISMVFVLFIIARASMERMAEVLREESDIQNKENPKTDVRDGSIRFENVMFSYSARAEKPVLDHINIDIASGETIGIIGGTGSSKSSLVQLIPRLYDVSEGCVKVGGEDVRDYDLTTLRNQVAMVLQKNILFSGTIRDNLRWGKEDATDEEMIHACKLAQADPFIQEFPNGYDTWIEQGGSNVSGGQRQRLCIARALLKKPKILILDDSTSAVDTKTDALIREAFLDEIPDTTKVIIAQRISSVQDADRIIVLDDGRVTDIGTHEELLARSVIYREVFESQQKGGLQDA